MPLPDRVERTDQRPSLRGKHQALPCSANGQSESCKARCLTVHKLPPGLAIGFLNLVIYGPTLHAFQHWATTPKETSWSWLWGLLLCFWMARCTCFRSPSSAVFTARGLSSRTWLERVRKFGYWSNNALRCHAALATAVRWCISTVSGVTVNSLVGGAMTRGPALWRLWATTNVRSCLRPWRHCTDAQGKSGLLCS